MICWTCKFEKQCIVSQTQRLTQTYCPRYKYRPGSDEELERLSKKSKVENNKYHE